LAALAGCTMKVAGIRNAILLFFGGLIAWGLIVWLPHRELLHLVESLGRPENLPPLTNKIYSLNMTIYSLRYLFLILYALGCVGYYFFYLWARKGTDGRMILHNVVVAAFIIAVYAFLIYNVFGVRAAMKGVGA
jgi:hypothetical protein